MHKKHGRADPCATMGDIEFVRATWVLEGAFERAASIEDSSPE
jgi:hypothetical protein